MLPILINEMKCEFWYHENDKILFKLCTGEKPKLHVNIYSGLDIPLSPEAMVVRRKCMSWARFASF